MFMFIKGIPYDQLTSDTMMDINMDRMESMSLPAGKGKGTPDKGKGTPDRTKAVAEKLKLPATSITLSAMFTLDSGESLVVTGLPETRAMLRMGFRFMSEPVTSPAPLDRQRILREVGCGTTANRTVAGTFYGSTSAMLFNTTNGERCIVVLHCCCILAECCIARVVH